MRTKFLSWILIISLIGLGILSSWYFGIIELIFKGDITKITCLISAIFIFGSIKTGISIWKQKEDKWLEKFASICTSLGLLGTVIGFSIMLNINGLLDIENQEQIKEVLSQMTDGMGSALYTTIVGLVSSILLRIQGWLK